jgi:two-component system, chemotaxis family, chemotaxis protein CheY
VAKSVLVVDDSNSMRQMVTFTMKEAGYDVIEGSNGQEALDRVKGKSVNLVITDLNMPVMDGMSMIRTLRGIPEFKFTPILMLTTESQQEKKAEGKAAGATGWIVKPFNPEQLLQVVGKVVR